MKPVIARSSAGATALALALASAAALAGCGREPAPAAAPLPPPPADQPLAGAPEGPPLPPPAVAPEGQRPLPPEGPPPLPPMEAPSAAEPGVVAMAPIPNPPEAPSHSYRPRRDGGAAGAYSHPGHGRRVHRLSQGVAQAPARSAQPVHHSTARSAAPAASYAGAPGAAGSGVAAAAHHGRATAPQAHHGATRTATTPPAAAGPRADRLAALQTALGGAMSQSAKLDTPRFAPNQPADVSLTVPAQFAETLRTEAGRQGLADDAASVALIARLAGDGYVVIPDTVQRQMLAAGQPTVFHWTVTRQAGARGPLQAGVAAQLMGVGGQDQLDLGVIKGAQGSGAGWKVVGAIVLLLAVAAIVALLARMGGGGDRAGGRRRRPVEVRTARPFDMSGLAPPERRDDRPPRA